MIQRNFPAPAWLDLKTLAPQPFIEVATPPPYRTAERNASYGFLEIAITPSVKAVQAKMGADHIWQDFKGHREFNRFTDNEAAFIADRDSFYMATVLETGWPYVQHRGGPRGFLSVIDEHTRRLSGQPPIYKHWQPRG